jgi:outer membrane immunogenic protein
MMKQLGLIVSLGIGLASIQNALAADLPVPPPVYHAPAVVAPTWTGLYLGVNGGWGWTSNFNASSTFFDPTGATVISPGASNLSATGAVFGGQVGYNWQTGNWVWGVEGDFDGTNINKFSNAGVLVATAVPPLGLNEPFHVNIDWLASIRARLGYGWGPGMVYVTGGGAWASAEFNAGGPADTFLFSSTSTRSGWTIGAGYEWLMNPNWSVRGEYLYYRFAGATANTVTGTGLAPAGTFVTHALGNFDVNVVRVALNYKFDWWR